jgi:hypothetical protein
MKYLFALALFASSAHANLNCDFFIETHGSELRYGFRVKGDTGHEVNTPYLKRVINPTPDLNDAACEDAVRALYEARGNCTIFWANVSNFIENYSYSSGYTGPLTKCKAEARSHHASTVHATTPPDPGAPANR